MLSASVRRILATSKSVDGWKASLMVLIVMPMDLTLLVMVVCVLEVVDVVEVPIEAVCVCRLGAGVLL